MYSTCLHCTRDLGSNQVIDTLPIGRRVVFDAAQGRLWVVCLHCAKWNLVPFETRLESIDAAERMFADTRTRFSTDNIGLARLKEGLELVRIGPALRPEFAAWRYGDQFGRRRKRALLIGAAIAAAGVGLGAGLVAGGMAIGVGVGTGPSLLPQFVRLTDWALRGRKVIVRVAREDAPPLELTGVLASKANFVWMEDGRWGVRTNLHQRGRVVRTAHVRLDGEHLITGPDAERLLAGVLAQANRYAGTRSDVQDAVQLVESEGSVSGLVSAVHAPSKFTRVKLVKELPRSWRLATEMALHEQSEREAIAGELALLEWHWKEAERLAKISDDLALPEGIEEELERRRR